MIKIDTSEIDKFVIDLKDTSENIRSDVQKVLKKSGFNIEAKAKLNITNNGSVKTGHLRRGITSFSFSKAGIKKGLAFDPGCLTLFTGCFAPFQYKAFLFLALIIWDLVPSSTPLAYLIWKLLFILLILNMLEVLKRELGHIP